MVDKRKRRRRASPSPGPRRESRASNELWCMDFKGQFRLGNKSYCYPLTVTDHFSRYLVCCDGLENTQSAPAARALEATFLEHGLPEAIRSDNGSPFASTGRYGLTTLSVWLMRLNIALERIEPGHPEQNGRHERMHRTLKADATRPASANLLQQQERFDEFREVFNNERPHEAHSQKTPGSVYSASRRQLPSELPPLEYPLHDHTVTVASNGTIRLRAAKQTYVGQALAGQQVGMREVDDGTWLVTFMGPRHRIPRRSLKPRRRNESGRPAGVTHVAGLKRYLSPGLHSVLSGVSDLGPWWLRGFSIFFALLAHVSSALYPSSRSCVPDVSTAL